MTDLIEVKTAELTGAALDWAVAQIDEVKTIMLKVRSSEQKKPFAMFGSLALPIGNAEAGYSPSTDWSQGGPLIDRYRVGIYCDYTEQETITANVTGSGAASAGTTFLIAACRAIVASVLGETVSVPKELLP